VEALTRPVYLKKSTRIDNGEKVRIYSTTKFKGKKINGTDNIYLNGIQVMQGEDIVFQADYAVNGHVVSFLSDEKIQEIRKKK
tara:strand:+ start:275 stop:523 length:249 start_codon:yes stop_codon:yes gene_type:complete